MRICIATGPWLPVPPLQGGAMARAWMGLAEEFAKRGHSVVIVARNFHGQPAREVLRGVRYIRTRGFAQSNNIWWDLLKDLIYAIGLQRYLPAADIFVTNDFWLPVLTPWLRRDAGQVVISANRYPKGQYRMYDRASRIVASSRAIRDAVVQQRPSLTSRTVVIPNPIDTGIFKTTDSSVSRTLSHKRLLYVGRLHPEKGVHLLLEAVKAGFSSGVELEIVGPHRADQGGGGEEYKRRLEGLASGLPVTFTGPIFDVDQLCSRYQKADVFCYPSLAEKGEAMGVAPLEAMACGTLPVVSMLPCFTDFIQDGISGIFFDHRSVDPVKALVDALHQALSARHHDMRNRAIETGAKYAFSKIAPSFVSEFDKLVSSPSKLCVPL